MKDPMNLKQLQKLVEKWQKQLRLQDWRVVVQVTSTSQLPNTDCYAATLISPGMKRALIMLRDPADPHSADADYGPNDIEQTIVHELLHLHFNGLMPMPANTLEENIIEQGIESIAWALVNVDRAK